MVFQWFSSNFSWLGAPKRPRFTGPDVASYGMALKACERGRLWQLGTQFLNDMRQSLVKASEKRLKIIKTYLKIHQK